MPFLLDPFSIFPLPRVLFPTNTRSSSSQSIHVSSSIKLTYFPQNNSDYNYERRNDGSCGLVPGLSPLDHSQICEQDPNVIEYYEPTGYRRIPLTTCQGGRELEFLESKARPCPNHQEDFDREHSQKGRLSAFSFFLLVVLLPCSAACGVGYYFYRHWDGKFGRIRLGEMGGSSSSDVGRRRSSAFLGGILPNGNGSLDSGGGDGRRSSSGGGGGGRMWDAKRPWIKYPVMAIAVSVAIVVSIPDTTSRVWRSVRSGFGFFGGGSGGRDGRGRYTTRQSLAGARGGAGSRGEYDDGVVDTDEGELLGDESDDDHYDDDDDDVVADDATAGNGNGNARAQV